MQEKVIEIRNLEKSYKNNKAVDKLEFDVYKGEILGLLGPNGAGKSTTISILSTILKKDNGDINVFGKNLDTNVEFVKSKLGIVPQDIAIYDNVTAFRNVEFFASLYGVKKKDLKINVLEALRFVGLEDKKDDKPKTFSGGMKRRLNIACAIAHHPDLLILDEPTVGIDPQSRNHILNSIKELRKLGTTVIYTTHYMEEVAEIADRIIIIDKGRKIAEGTLSELLEKYKNTRKYKLHIPNMRNSNMDFLKEIEGIQKVTLKEDVLEIKVSKEKENLDKILLKLIEKNYTIGHMETTEGNLEMVFLDLTGKTLRD